MGRKYATVFEEVSVSASQDLFEIVSSASAITVIHGFEISQSSDTDSEGLSLLVHRGSTSGSGGSSGSPWPLDPGDAAYGGTVEMNNTDPGTEGNIIHSAAFNVLSGYVWWPTPEIRPVIGPGDQLNILLQTTPGDALTMSGAIFFEEIG